MSTIDVDALLAENARLRAENERLRAEAPLDVHEQEDGVTTTVVARIRALGVRSDRKFSWRVGSVVRGAWERTYGTLPVKANTTKVSGHGSHCHARYPLSWTRRIDALIAYHAGMEGVQMLFPWAGSAPDETPQGADVALAASDA